MMGPGTRVSLALAGHAATCTAAHRPQLATRPDTVDRCLDLRAANTW